MGAAGNGLMRGVHIRDDFLYETGRKKRKLLWIQPYISYFLSPL